MSEEMHQREGDPHALIAELEAELNALKARLEGREDDKIRRIGTLIERLRAIICATAPVCDHDQLPEDPQKLLELIAKTGFLRGYTSMSPEYARRHPAALQEGFTSFCTTHTLGEGYPDRNSPTDAVVLPHLIGLSDYELQKMKVHAAVGVAPVQRKYRKLEKREVKGWFGTHEENELAKEMTIESVPLSQFPGNSDKDSRPAFQLLYFRIDDNSPESAEAYSDPTTGRSGNKLYVSIVLPENLARAALQEIERDPTFMRRLIERMDPDLVHTQTKRKGDYGGLPPDTKILIVGKERKIVAVNSEEL